MLISTASASASSRRWHRTTSSTVTPEILTTIGTLLLADRYCSSCRATGTSPLLGNPIALMREDSPASRNSLGLGLPGRGCAVTVPTVRYPNPSDARDGIISQSLSNPAASPTGFDSGIPQSVVVESPVSYLKRRSQRLPHYCAVLCSDFSANFLGRLRREAEKQRTDKVRVGVWVENEHVRFLVRFNVSRHSG